MNILLVYPDAKREYFADIRTELEKKFEDSEVEVTVEQDKMHAERKIQGNTRFDLIVAYVEFELETGSAPDPEAAFTVENFLRTNNIDIPIVIVVPQLNNLMFHKTCHPLSQVFAMDRSLIDSIVIFARERRPPMKQLNILLNLSTREEIPDWRYTIKGKHFPELKMYDGKLKKPDDYRLKMIAQFTKDIDNLKIDDWENRMHLIGKDLYELLVDSNDQFRMDLQYALKQLGKLEQARVQFVVDEKVYPVLLEAVCSPDAEHDFCCGSGFWLEYSPLVRRVRENSNGYTLFEREERVPINVLILCSDTSGPVEVEVTKLKQKILLDLEKLDNVTDECMELATHLHKLKKQGVNLGDIRVIPSDSKEVLHKDDIKKTLEGKRWDIVHYAGHSYTDEDSESAYVFFNNDGGYVEPVKIERFAGYMKRTRLLVLSSCTSCHQNFVFELAKHQIPAVLGFRGKISDNRAHDFSKDFFHYLFETKSVDGAFYRARKSLYDNCDNNDRAWTKPVLVLESIN